jgi:hypothetical protein
MTTLINISKHQNYNADDYAYLAAKGWTEEQIQARWEQEAASGTGPCRWQTEGARAKLASVIRNSTLNRKNKL